MNVISRMPKLQAARHLFIENRRLALSLTVFSVMPLLFSSVLGGWLLSHRELVSELVPEYGLVLILLSCLTMAMGLTPTTFVALVSGFFLGIESAVFLVLAYMLASAIGYCLGHFLDGGRFLQSLMQYHLASQVTEDLRSDPVSMVILVRLSPALPFCLMNLLLAALKVRFLTYLLAGAVGMLPRTLLSLWIGSQSRDLVELIESGGGQLETGMIIVGSIFTVALLVWLVMKRIRKYFRVC